MFINIAFFHQYCVFSSNFFAVIPQMHPFMCNKSEGEKNGTKWPISSLWYIVPPPLGSPKL